MTDLEWNSYTAALKSGNFIKLARLRFLNQDGTTAFSLDNDPYNERSGAFIRGGSVSCNLQNGQRWTASVTLENTDGSYDYNINKVWFGTEIAVDMGLSTNGVELYFPMGVYRVGDPADCVAHNGRTASFALKDKWAGLDGTLNGRLEASYAISEGTNIFAPIASVLQTDRGDGQPYDNVPPLFTEYYNGKTQSLADGTTALLTDAPFQLIIDSEDGSVADLILGLADMLVALVGYDASGRLRIDPSQNDIVDSDKPVGWRFLLTENQILGQIDYKALIEDVLNDYIVVGAMSDTYAQVGARAQNLDPTSPTNVNKIGRRTKRESRPEYATQRICEDYAVWTLKRQAALRQSVSFSANQIFHLAVNEIVEIVRTDMPNTPTERHLVQGFTIPFSGTEPMTINAVSVHDFPEITVQTWPLAE